MRGKKTRFLLVIALVLVMMIPACTLLAQAGLFAPWTIWPTYHHDPFHTGQNINSTDTKDPSTIKAVWVFPRTDAGTDRPDEADLIVDDNDAVNFTATGTYSIVNNDGDAYNSSYHVMDATKNTSAPRFSHFDWLFADDRLPHGKYQIFVWIPADKAFATTGAVYTVYDDYGSRDFVLNQAAAAGTWQALSNSFFTFTGLRPREGVRLSALVSNAALSGTKVIGDAVKFVPATAQEIYSSPASANIRCTLTDPDDPSVTIYDEVDTCVYTGTVEVGPAGPSGFNNRDKGAVYCIYGITPTTVNPALKDGTPNPTVPDSARLVKISKYLGKPKWRYPRNGALTNDRLPVEGPISGGVYSSPTLAFISQPSGAPKLVAFVAGMDRQLYALDAETGDLLWKGPGFTAGEESDPVVMASGSAWQQTKDREDAFGGQFHYVPCADTPDNTATWLFTAQDQQNMLGMSGAEGLSYSIFAWLPDAGGTGPHFRSRNATYTIKYYDPRTTDGNAEATITVDQSAAGSMGTWVKIGSSYFNPTSVVLKNTAAVDPPADPDNPSPTDPKASDYCVVADALMFVPDTMEGLGYSTPITNAMPPPGGGTAIATNVFQATETGRVLSFMIDAMPNNIGRINWIYPAVRTKKMPKPSEMDQNSLGSIGASPAYKEDKLYVASMDGELHCLRASDGTQEWTFSTGGSATTGEGGGGFSSSPSLDNTNIYIASTGGHFYCLNMDGTVKWEYPSDANDPPDNPLGAFRYSTPAVATDSRGVKRVWCASTDGHIYSFRAETGDRLYIDDGGTPQPTGTAQAYDEPSFGKPVQGSVALDGPGSSGQHIIMYVGDMGDRQGTLHWRDAETGEVPNYFGNYGQIDPATGLPYETYEGWTAPDILFSSPNITNIKVDTTPITWIYIGCADGHLIAFSKKGGGWGGEWQGGDWPFAGDSDTQNAQRTSAAPETSVQFDVFAEPFFNQSLSLNPEPAAATFDPAAWPVDTIVSKLMKLPGETDPLKIDQYLTDQAKLQRNQTNLAVSRVGTTAASTGVVSDTVFYEWGEKIYSIIWNLPAQDYLEGSNITDKVRVRMTNQSCGESAGATSSGQNGNVDGLVIQVRALKDYTVLKASVDSNGQTTYGPCVDINGDPVKRSYALISIDIDGGANRRRPPGPGPGWALYVDIDKRPYKTTPAGGGSPTYGPAVRQSIPLAKLKAGRSGGYDIVTIDRVVNGKTVPGQPREAPLGINNPIAIRDDGIKDTAGNGSVQIAWTTNTATGWRPNRYDPDVHLNGNNRWQATTDNSGRYNFTRLSNPLIYLDNVVHGTSSREAPMGIADRSAMGLQRRQIGNFRIEERDLSFRGGESAIECPTSVAGVKWGFKFPWDMGISSIDYPDLYRRYQSFQLVSTDIDPSDRATPLLAVQPTTTGLFEDSYVQPDTVLVSVDVPRFQPANVSADLPGYTMGYSRSMNAFIDSNNDGNFDSGNTSRGRPVSWQEAYRTFRVGIKVPPDPKIEVDEQLIDIGRTPHGLGQNLLNGFTFTAYNKNPLIQQWFKKLTIKNAGNVNLYNIRLNQALGLFGDQASPSQILPGAAITSSLDVFAPPGAFSSFGADPFLCSTANDAAGAPTFLGYTLSKPRVGDADPTVMTIPDRRRWDVLFSDRQAAEQILTDFAWSATPADAEPLPVLVSVQVPLTQPVGTYQSWDPNYNAPYIAVFSNHAKGSSWNSKAISPSAGDPVAMPSFQLKLAVRENQLTGGLTPTTLPQIDFMTNASGEPVAPPDLLPRWGDATPAAFRDAKNLGVHLFWSSNRLPAPPAPGDPNFANAPWFINHTVLGYEGSVGGRPGKWLTADPNHWWAYPDPAPLPASQWTIPSGGTPPPDLMVFSGTGNTALYSVRHFSPSIAENQARSAGATSNRTWLTWSGTADFKGPNNKVRQENLLFYTDMTQNPDPAKAGDPPPVYAILHDPTMQKRYPSALADGNDMWMFWQGGNAGNWSIYYSHSTAGPAFDNNAADIWQQDAKLRTPDSLAAAGSPNPILRHLWADLRGSNSSGSSDFTDPFMTEYSAATKLIDVVYAGTNKVTRNADVMLSRYIAVPSVTSSRSPARAAQPLPRVYNEKLARDSKLGFYTSEHIAWVRLRAGQSGVPDIWGVYNASNLPYVRVYFPNAYTDGTISIPAGSFISATDSITPEIDAASGVYTYTYPVGTLAEQVLGKMIVDFSSGIIRFQKPFKETPVTVNSVTAFSAPEVRADYTPQAWRITTDDAVDGSPRAFIERTSMSDPNESQTGARITPGLEPRASWPSAKPAPVDRMWIFWRKTGASIENSTIFYKTMRIGVDLTKLGLPAIPMNPLTGTIGNADVPNPNVTVSGALGPWEVDRTGTKIYFSEVDERYESMPGYLGAPGPISISYTFGNSTGQTASRSVPDVSWLTELPEQSLNPMMDANVNEGSIYAFADPHPQESGTSTNVRSSKIWVFWTSTRGGNSDLFWETLSPNFWGR